MRFDLEITGMGNAAFQDDENGYGGAAEAEVARALRDVADRIEAGALDSGFVWDYNGNKVGQYRVTESE